MCLLTRPMSLAGDGVVRWHGSDSGMCFLGRAGMGPLDTKGVPSEGNATRECRGPNYGV